MGHFIKKINLVLVLAISLMLFSFGFASYPALADNASDAVCNGVTIAGGGSCGDANTTNTSVNSLLASIINVFSWAVGFIAVLMIVIGGLLYVIAAGDSTKTARARNTIIYALVGLIIVALAQVIVHFVLSNIQI